MTFINRFGFPLKKFCGNNETGEIICFYCYSPKINYSFLPKGNVEAEKSRKKAVLVNFSKNLVILFNNKLHAI